MAKQTYHHGDLRRALLQAADEAITENGVAALSMRDLARRAGVSHAAPTHHFGDKAGLLTAYATEGFEQLAKALATSRLASNSFLELGVTYIRFAVTRRALFEVMFRPDLYHAADPDLLAARAKAADSLYAAVSDLPDGTLAPPPHDPNTHPAEGAPAADPGAPAADPGAPAAGSGAPAAGSGAPAADQEAHAADRDARPADATARSANSARSSNPARPTSPARPARPGTAEVAPAAVRIAGLAAWSMAHGFATLWLTGAFPDRDLDPTEMARLILTELNRDAAAQGG